MIHPAAALPVGPAMSVSSFTLSHAAADSEDCTHLATAESSVLCLHSLMMSGKQLLSKVQPKGLLSHKNEPPALPERRSVSHAACALGSPVLIACLPKQRQPQPHVVSCLKPTLLYNHPCSIYSYIAAQIGQKGAFACIL